MLVIIESISAGLIISLINKYIINKNIFEQCLQEEEEKYDSEEVSSVVASISDNSSIHHIHV